MLAYRILGIDFINDNGAVRNAYLKRLEKFPPEKFPEEYKTVRKAYELVETEQNRINYFLFGGDDKFSFEEYSAVRFKLDTTITASKWERLCLNYQENNSKTKSGK